MFSYLTIPTSLLLFYPTSGFAPVEYSVCRVVGLPQIHQRLLQRDVDKRHPFSRNICRSVLSEGVETEDLSIDFYAILDIGRDADGKNIKAAYRRMAKCCHPDWNEGDEAAELTEILQKVNRAYEVLSDPVLKKRYDRFGKSGVGTSAMSDGTHLDDEEKSNRGFTPKRQADDERTRFVKWPVTRDDLRRSDLNRRGIIM